MEAADDTASSEGGAAVSIRPIEASERSLAVRRLRLGGMPVCGDQVEQLLSEIERLGLGVSLMWGGFGAGGHLLDVVLIVPQAGRTGMVFLSQPRGVAGVEGLAAVISKACEATPTDRVVLAQALLSPEARLQRRALEGAGFGELSSLCYMRSWVGRGGVAEPAFPSGVRLQTWSERRRGRFLEALDASYEKTLDCPGLHGLRRTEDVLAGHMSTGRFAPELWTLLLVDEEPAGVLLLNPVPSAGCVELVYLGLAPRFRGRGLASLLMRRAFAQTARRGQGQLTLAVDERNGPARALYERFGFEETGRKLAMIRPLSGPAGGASGA